MIKKIPFLLAPLLLSATAVSYANTIYSYNGPNFTGLSDHLSISFTTSTPLQPNKSYITTASANVVTGYVAVMNASGIVQGLNLPLSTFQVHTDSAGNIDAWDILGDISNLVNNAPIMQGSHLQAYSINTLAFIPGSDIPGAVGLVTGAYDYEQGTINAFYSSCALAPVGVNCTLAGNGQPYSYSYSGIINPSHTNGSWWQVTQGNNNPTPPAATINMSGTFPAGTVGVDYSTNLTVINGVAPFTWSVTGLPAGLTLTNGNVTGKPTTAGTYNITVTLKDSNNAVITHPYSVVINPAAQSSCSNKNAVISSVGRDFITVNGGNNVADHVWYTSTPAGTSFTGGTKGFKTGEIVDFNGSLDPVAGCYATSITVKPVPSSYTLQDEGVMKITAFGDHYIYVGNKKIIWDSTTSFSLNGKQIKVGMTADWNGLRDKTTNIVLAKQLEIK